MQFEWDEGKNQANVEKHGVDFETASRIFEGAILTDNDRRQDYGEVREVSIGKIEEIVTLVVVHTDRNGATRLISARLASREERRRYEQALREAVDR
ncbi:MAG: BrnT family toxin [Alphaproteobacteria bacterium]|nr:BrnT family toxin [Alphaproteobacteria bacterium]